MFSGRHYFDLQSATRKFYLTWSRSVGSIFKALKGCLTPFEIGANLINKEVIYYLGFKRNLA